MTIQGTVDAEISFDPSAPPLATSPSVPTNDVPIATATAVPIVSATAVPDTLASGNTQLSPGSNVERTTNTDGSLSVKVTKTTTRSDGFRSIRIEEYLIPANMAHSVIESTDLTGEAPSSLYLTKIEDHRLPPDGNSVEALQPPMYPTPDMPTGGGGATTTAQVVYNNDERRQNILAGLICGVTALVTLGVIFSVNSHHTMHSAYNPPSPSGDDDFWGPSHPTTSFTWPPVTFSWPQKPTKSPSPTTPYPTFDFDSYTYPPLYSPLFTSSLHVPRSVDATRIGKGNSEGHGHSIKIIPVIVSPKLRKEPATAPTPVFSPKSVNENKS